MFWKKLGKEESEQTKEWKGIDDETIEEIDRAQRNQ
jgi:hypothetical protein